jgi:hypothetical protein
MIRCITVLWLVLQVGGCARSERAPEAPASACTEPSSPREADGVRRLTLERTPCLGNCPVYRLVIHSNGRVDWTGERFVAVEGAAHRCVAPKQVAELWNEIDRLLAQHPEATTPTACVAHDVTPEGQVFEFGDTDQPSIRFTMEGLETTTWVHDFGCPESVPEQMLEIEASIRSLVDLDLWVHGRPRAAGRG